MAVITRPTVVGVFADRAQAERAVNELRLAGFRADQIGFMMRHSTTDETETKAQAGAITGAVSGGLVGGLLAAALAFIPGIGGVMAAGALAATLLGAATGATAGGLVGALVGVGIPEDAARQYEREFEAGAILVLVSAGERSDEAADLIRSCGGEIDPYLEQAS